MQRPEQRTGRRCAAGSAAGASCRPARWDSRRTTACPSRPAATQTSGRRAARARRRRRSAAVAAWPRAKAAAGWSADRPAWSRPGPGSGCRSVDGSQPGGDSRWASSPWRRRRTAWRGSGRPWSSAAVGRRLGSVPACSASLSDLYGAWRLLLAGAPREGYGVGGGAHRQQWIVRRLDSGRQRQRVEIDVAAVAVGFAAQRFDSQGASVDRLAVGGPRQRGIVRRIACPAEGQDQMPLCRAAREALDQVVEQIVLVVGRLLWRALERIDGAHRPAHRRRLARGVDQAESIEAVVAGVGEARWEGRAL